MYTKQRGTLQKKKRESKFILLPFKTFKIVNSKDVLQKSVGVFVIATSHSPFQCEINVSRIADVTPTREQSSVIRLPFISHCSSLCDVVMTTRPACVAEGWQLCYLCHLIYHITNIIDAKIGFKNGILPTRPRLLERLIFFKNIC